MKPTTQNANAGPGAGLSETEPDGQAIPNSPSNEALFAYAVQWPVRLLDDAADFSKLLFLLCAGFLGGGLALLDELVHYEPVALVVKALLLCAMIVSAVGFWPSTVVIPMHPDRIREALVSLATRKHSLSKLTMAILSVALFIVIAEQAACVVVQR